MLKWLGENRWIIVLMNYCTLAWLLCKALLQQDIFVLLGCFCTQLGHYLFTLLSNIMLSLVYGIDGEASMKLFSNLKCLLQISSSRTLFIKIYASLKLDALAARLTNFGWSCQYHWVQLILMSYWTFFPLKSCTSPFFALLVYLFKIYWLGIWFDALDIEYLESIPTYFNEVLIIVVMEEQFILRVPPSVAERIERLLNENPSSEELDLSFPGEYILVVFKHLWESNIKSLYFYNLGVKYDTIFILQS